MRANQLLLEKLTSVNINKFLALTLEKAYFEFIHKRFRADYRSLDFSFLNQDYDLSHKAPRHNYNINIIKKWIVAGFNYEYAKLLNQYIKLNSDNSYEREPFTILFLPTEHGGTFDAENNAININDKLSDSLAKETYEMISEFIIDNNFEISAIDIAQAYQYPKSTRLEQLLYRLHEILLHELVHYEQYSRSRVSNFYTSYVVRNTGKFYDLIKKSILEKAYYGSPQEIAAFASGESLKIVKEVMNSNYSLADKISILKDYLQTFNISHPEYRKFLNSVRNIDKKIVNRYIKKVYLEIDHYIDELESQLQNQNQDKY